MLKNCTENTHVRISVFVFYSSVLITETNLFCILLKCKVLTAMNIKIAVDKYLHTRLHGVTSEKSATFKVKR
jgi:hypothetical protein